MAVTPLSISDYLKYSELQMATEAFLVNPDGALRTDLDSAWGPWGPWGPWGQVLPFAFDE